MKIVKKINRHWRALLIMAVGISMFIFLNMNPYTEANGICRSMYLKEKYGADSGECLKCGSPIVFGVNEKYCRRCGQKADVLLIKEERNVCPECGRISEYEYCRNDGSRMEKKTVSGVENIPAICVIDIGYILTVFIILGYIISVCMVLYPPAWCLFRKER